jgi:hypothetical protein
MWEHHEALMAAPPPNHNRVFLGQIKYYAKASKINTIWIPVEPGRNGTVSMRRSLNNHFRSKPFTWDLGQMNTHILCDTDVSCDISAKPTTPEDLVSHGVKVVIVQIQ